MDPGLFLASLLHRVLLPRLLATSNFEFSPVGLCIRVSFETSGFISKHPGVCHSLALEGTCAAVAAAAAAAGSGTGIGKVAASACVILHISLLLPATTIPVRLVQFLVREINKEYDR